MKAHYVVQTMNEDGDFQTIKEFNTLSHALNFAAKWKQMGKKKTPMLILDQWRNIIVFRI